MGCVDCNHVAKETCEVKLPPRGETLAPWICIQFRDIGDPERVHKIITVGNDSAPDSDPKNAAAIKSLEFGQADGFKLNVVIQDQQGGAFELFMDHLFKDWKSAVPNPSNPVSVYMTFQFGWTTASCSGPAPGKTSPCFQALIQGIETSFEDGKFIAEVSAVDVGHIIPQGSLEKIWGVAGSGVCLREAIIQLMTTNDIPPSVDEVRMVKYSTDLNNGNTRIVPCGFEKYDNDCGCQDRTFGGKKPSFCEGSSSKKKDLGGVQSTWRPEALDKLHVLSDWLSNNPAEEGKPWRISFDPVVNDAFNGLGRMIISQVTEPECEAQTKQMLRKFCVGSYIVNGSKYSPVISFNPKLNWDFARYQSQGGTSPGNKTQPVTNEDGEPDIKSSGVKPCRSLSRNNNPGAGQATKNIVDDRSRDIWAAEAADKAYISQSRFSKANEHNLLHDPISADLVIVGDPQFANPWMFKEKLVSIVFINPFYIDPKKGEECGEWLAKPVRNSVLTNAAWRIRTFTHKIESGKYVTVLGLRLVVGDKNEPYGLWKDGET